MKVRRSSVSAAILAILFSTGSHAAICDGISTAPASPLTTVLVAGGLLRPLYAVAPPADPDRLFILEQDGKIQLLNKKQLTVFMDLSAITRSPADGNGNEEGLLGLAFPADYATSGLFFVYYTDLAGNNNLVRYARLDDDHGDPASAQPVLSFAHPGNANHNGGMITFGPDGLLYIATGDGGGSCDTPGNAQNGASNLGKLLRIDVTTLPYTIPPTNPFVGPDAFNDEIFSYGLRNPWRLSFDRGTGDLYIGDVGQGSFEEIDYRPSGSQGGENFGWDIFEGLHCPNPSCGSQGSCLITRVDPVFEYSLAGTPCAVTGGYVYQGCRMPALHGTYFYSDHCAAFIRSFQMVGGAVTNQVDHTAELAPGGGLAIQSITSYGEDARGEMYIVDRGGIFPSTATGELYKIVPILPNLEVSGLNAQPFLLSPSSYTWENLQATSSHPITAYKVYRSVGNGSGLFTCVHQDATTTWVGGDPTMPGDGELFSYVVTAVNAAGVQSSPGTGTGGTPRSLSTDPCPAPERASIR